MLYRTCALCTRPLLVVLLGGVSLLCANHAIAQAPVKSTAPAPNSAPASAPAAAQTPQVPPQTIPGPIKAEPLITKFGVVEPGTTVSTTIKLINPLDRPITIRAAKPSCTCTTVDMAGKVIPAGGSIDMPMSMKTAHSVGEKIAQVNVVFEGLEQLLAVRLEAETAYAVRGNPAYIDALAPERMKGFFELIATDDQPFEVLSVAGLPPETADDTAMRPAARHVLRYDFTRNPKAPVPPFLIVETNHPKCPVLDLRVRHETTRITPSLGFAEYRANLGVVAPETSADFELEIKRMGTARIDSVTSLAPNAKTELVGQRSDGDSVLVSVRVTDTGLPKGIFLFPCRFTSGQKSSIFYLYGTIR